MVEFFKETFVPVVAYFVGVTFCISIVIFGAAVAIDLVSDPITVADIQ